MDRGGDPKQDGLDMSEEKRSQGGLQGLDLSPQVDRASGRAGGAGTGGRQG